MYSFISVIHVTYPLAILFMRLKVIIDAARYYHQSASDTIKTNE